ncbi:MAG: hypothetical protein IJP01_06710 [Oscillospiraceae bacterium]|nr:hypothetical protein [Oscillospiraceae bacterium]
MKRNCNASSRPDVQGGWRDFAKGFFITLAVLLPVYLLVMAWAAGKAQQKEAPQELEAAAAPQQNAPITPQAYNLQLILTEDDALLGTLLLRYDPETAEIQLAALPAETVLLHSRRTLLAQDIYRDLGAMALQQAVGETLGTAVSGWCCIEPQTLLPLFADADAANLALPQGRLQLTAEQIFLQLRGVLAPQQKAELLHTAAGALLGALPAADLQERILQLYAEAPPQRGNIDAAGIHALARAAAACCGPQGFALQDAYADGSWTEDGRFVLAQGSDLALQRRFGKLS